MSKKRRNKKKLTTLKEALSSINDQSLAIKQFSREFFKDADIGIRKHKNKKKYTRKEKYKK